MSYALTPNSDIFHADDEINNKVPKLDLEKKNDNNGTPTATINNNNDQRITFLELIDGLKETIGDNKGIADLSKESVDKLQTLLLSYKSNKEDWDQFVHWQSHKYTRNLVDCGNGHFNLIVICWPKGIVSAIHDHPNSHCIVKVLDGSMIETRYDWPANKIVPETVTETNQSELIQTRRMTVGVDDVSYMHGKVCIPLQ